MNKIDTFALPLILPYLKSTDLCRLRTVNRLYHYLTDKYLYATHQTKYLQNLVCPNCASFFESEENTDPSYYDILYGAVHEFEEYRFDCVEQILGSSTRQHLLCEECEDEEVEDPKQGIQRFRYEGTRRYLLYIYYSYIPQQQWAFLVTTIKGKHYWEQYHCFLPPKCMISEYALYDNGEYYGYYNYDNDDEDDDDEDIIEWAYSRNGDGGDGGSDMDNMTD
jgi:hypothetical protein